MAYRWQCWAAELMAASTASDGGKKDSFDDARQVGGSCPPAVE
ncbi:hypothetical protein [Arthrobacter sp. TMN-49]